MLAASDESETQSRAPEDRREERRKRRVITAKKKQQNREAQKRHREFDTDLTFVLSLWHFGRGKEES